MKVGGGKGGFSPYTRITQKFRSSGEENLSKLLNCFLLLPTLYLTGWKIRLQGRMLLCRRNKNFHAAWCTVWQLIVDNSVYFTKQVERYG
ncbi:MAG TPA: hypothetical protein DDZ80_09685 [Cyanobacteria bacterium UBA8803]|nr:hypothetical protein [Cyanobacteria bacterium UBA9273]HBL58766.1 hypothetical protein [Cyanobacteria bacterium UBA8803]